MKTYEIFHIKKFYRLTIISILALILVPQNIFGYLYSPEFKKFIKLTDQLYIQSKGWNYGTLKKEYPILLAEFLGHSLRVHFFQIKNDNHKKKILDNLYSESERYMFHIASYCGSMDATGKKADKNVLWQHFLFSYKGGLDNSFRRNYNLNVSDAPSIFSENQVPEINGLPIINRNVLPNGNNMKMMGVPYSGNAGNTTYKDYTNKKTKNVPLSPDMLVGSWQQLLGFYTKKPNEPTDYVIFFKKTGQNYTAYLTKHPNTEYAKDWYHINKPFYIATPVGYSKKAKSFEFKVKLLNCARTDNRQVRVYDESGLWLYIDERGLIFSLNSASTYWKKIK